jgi:cytochrome c biogenesis factor
MPITPVSLTAAALSALVAAVLHMPSFARHAGARMVRGVLAILAVVLVVFALAPSSSGPLDRVVVEASIVILAVVAAAPLMSATDISWIQWATVVGIGGMLTLVASYVAGLRDPRIAVLFTVSGALLVAAVWSLVRRLPDGLSAVLSASAPAGAALMAVGLAVVLGLGRTERVQLPQGTAVEVLGHRLTFTGRQGADARTTTADIRVERGVWHAVVKPNAARPALDLLHGFSIAPVTLTAVQPNTAAAQWLLKNEPHTIAGAEYVFRGFRMERRGEAVPRVRRSRCDARTAAP